MIGDYYEIFERKTVERAIPIRAILELTYECNFHCRHCYVVRDLSKELCRHCYVVRDLSKEPLTQEQAKGVLEQLAGAGCLAVTLSGGEIFTRPDVIEIAQYARDLRFAIRFFTNGSLIDSEVAKEIERLRPLEIDVSIYGASEDTYEKVTGDGVNYHATIRGLESLARKDLNLFVKILLVKDNLHDLAEMKNIARDLGARYLLNPQITPRDDGNPNPVGCSIGDADLSEYMSTYGEKIPRRKRAFSDIICNIARNGTAISPYGDVFPCIQLKASAGNVLDSSLREVWDNSELLREIRKLRFEDFDECFDCRHADYCMICPGISYLESRRLNGPNQYGCKISSLREELQLIQ